MKARELKEILSAFNDDVEIFVSIKNPAVSTPKYWLEQGWGNHDGRYTITCPFCHKEYGIEIYPKNGGSDIPNRCTFCGIELKKNPKGE